MSETKVFKWRAISADGEQCSGEIEAESVDAVMLVLYKNNFQEFDRRSNY